MLTTAPSSFDLVDLTPAVKNVPINYGTFNNMGIFSEEPVSSETVIFEEITESGAVIVDRVRGEKNLTNKGRDRKLHSFLVPHYPQDDYVSPKDLASKSAYESLTQDQKLQEVVESKTKRLLMNHDWTLNKARAQALFSGTVYAPSGTVSQDWNTEFGVTRTSVDLVLGTAGTEILDKIEQIIVAVQDGMGGNGIFSGIVCPMDSGIFSRFIAHPKVTAAYSFYVANTGNDPMRGRLSANGSPMQMGREFYFGGITFKEVRDVYNGVKLATANEGVAVPTGSDMFKTYFAPAERFGLVNTDGERVYLFQKPDSDNLKIELQSESNHVSALLRPKGVVRVFSSN